MDSFVKQVVTTPYIDGLTVSIAKYDGYIMVMEPGTKRPIMPIQRFLSSYSFEKKDIVLHVICKESIFFDSLTFATALMPILEKFPQLNFYVYSSENSFVNTLKRFTNRIPIGKFVVKNNMDYADVDFYVFNPESYRASIIRSLLRKHRGVMLVTSSIEEEKEMMDHLNQSYEEGQLSKEEILQCLFLTPNPDIIYHALYGPRNEDFS